MYRHGLMEDQVNFKIFDITAWETNNWNTRIKGTVMQINKYVIASTPITNTESFASIAVLVFKLSSRKVLFINRKDNRNCLKVGYFLRK